MAIDVLQDKIRKLKNPSMIDFGITQDHLPAHLVEEEGTFLGAYGRFCRELMEQLKMAVPAVRFSFGTFALYGPDGLVLLEQLLAQAWELGYYVVLDAPEILSSWGADRVAQHLLEQGRYFCDGLVVSPYIGTDGIKPFVSVCKKTGKDLFPIVRSANKTAAELQDLLTGSRHVHIAAADLVSRNGAEVIGKCGYSQIGALASAGAASSLKNLRAKYNRMFLLVDGLDYPSGNAKNCSHAFDKFGHGAIVCAGPSVTAAWVEAGTDGRNYLEQAKLAAERMKKNITRYITVL